MHKNSWIILITLVLLGIGAFIYFTWPSSYKAAEISAGGTITVLSDTTAAASDKVVQDSAWAWKYTKLPNGNTVTPEEPSDYLLAFDTTTKVVATTDCGIYIGSFTTDNSSDLSLLAFTQSGTKTCPTDSVEASYKSTLLQTNSYNIDQNELHLVLKDGSLMSFTRQYANK